MSSALPPRSRAPGALLCHVDHRSPPRPRSPASSRSSQCSLQSSPPGQATPWRWRSACPRRTALPVCPCSCPALRILLNQLAVLLLGWSAVAGRDLEPRRRPEGRAQRVALRNPLLRCPVHPSPPRPPAHTHTHSPRSDPPSLLCDGGFGEACNFLRDDFSHVVPCSARGPAADSRTAHLLPAHPAQTQNSAPPTDHRRWLRAGFRRGGCFGPVAAGRRGWGGWGGAPCGACRSWRWRGRGTGACRAAGGGRHGRRGGGSSFGGCLRPVSELWRRHNGRSCLGAARPSSRRHSNGTLPGTLENHVACVTLCKYLQPRSPRPPAPVSRVRA